MILLYHKIDFQWEIHPSRVSPALFQKHMDILYEEGYHVVPLCEYIHCENEKYASITFDDGYRNVYQYAFPIMEKYGFRGTVYMPTAYIGKENDWDVNIGGKKFFHLSEKEIEELSSFNWEISSHGMDHQSFFTLNDDELLFQLKKSREMIEQITKKNAPGISYPFGHYNKKIIEMSRKIYKYGAAVKCFSKGKYKISRIPIYSFDLPLFFYWKIKNVFLISFFYSFWGWFSFLFTFGSVIVRKMKKLNF